MALGDVDLGLLGDGVDDGPAVLALDFLLGLLGDAAGNLVLELLERVVAEVLGCELVSQLGQFLCLDGVDLDLEDLDVDPKNVNLDLKFLKKPSKSSKSLNIPRKSSVRPRSRSKFLD